MSRGFVYAMALIVGMGACFVWLEEGQDTRRQRARPASLDKEAVQTIIVGAGFACPTVRRAEATGLQARGEGIRATCAAPDGRSLRYRVTLRSGLPPIVEPVDP